MSIAIKYIPDVYIVNGALPYAAANLARHQVKGELFYGYRRAGYPGVRLYFEFADPKVSSAYSLSAGLHYSEVETPAAAGDPLVLRSMNTVWRNNSLFLWLSDPSNFQPGQKYTHKRHTIETLTMAELQHIASLSLETVTAHDGDMY